MNTLLREWEAARDMMAPMIDKWPIWWPAAVCVGLVLAMVAAAILGESRHRDTTRCVRRMTKRGTRPSRIARHMGLAQDMVRDLVAVGADGEAPEFSSELWNRMTGPMSSRHAERR